MVKLFGVFMSPEAPVEVSKVLMSGYIGEGLKVEEFEKQLGEFVDNPRVLAVNSGTSAIMMALRCAGVGYGDTVVSTPMTCLATNEAVLALGAQIEWADVDPKTGLMDVKSVDSILRPGRYADAILCVHWGGAPCHVVALNSFDIPVIEDACQALGSMYNGEMIGNHSRFVCTSFQAIKTLTTGDGGAIFFRDKEDFERARLMRWFGLDRRSSKDMRCGQDPPEFGYKMQMNDIAAAIGLCNIKHLTKNLDQMNVNVCSYAWAIEKNPSIELSDSLSPSSNWLCTVLVDDSKHFIEYMKNRDIECSKVHDRNDTKKIFSAYKKNLPGVDEFDRRHVCIPCGWWLSDEEVEKVMDALENYRKG